LTQGKAFHLVRDHRPPTDPVSYLPIPPVCLGYSSALEMAPDAYI